MKHTFHPFPLDGLFAFAVHRSSTISTDADAGADLGRRFVCQRLRRPLLPSPAAPHGAVSGGRCVRACVRACCVERTSHNITHGGQPGCWAEHKEFHPAEHAIYVLLGPIVSLGVSVHAGELAARCPRRAVAAVRVRSALSTR